MPVHAGATNSAKCAEFSVIRAVGVTNILDWTLQLNNGKARP